MLADFPDGLKQGRAWPRSRRVRRADVGQDFRALPGSPQRVISRACIPGANLNWRACGGNSMIGLWKRNPIAQSRAPSRSIRPV